MAAKGNILRLNVITTYATSASDTIQDYEGLMQFYLHSKFSYYYYYVYIFVAYFITHSQHKHKIILKVYMQIASQCYC